MATKTAESYWKRGKLDTRWGMTEFACFAGQPKQPRRCTRHHEHFWCTVCEGFYGVPHDGFTHGEQAGGHVRECVCRPCREFHASYAKTENERRDLLTVHGSVYHHEFPPPAKLLA